jgi:hypothetical protein
MFQKLPLLLSSGKNVQAALLRPLDWTDLYLQGYRFYESNDINVLILLFYLMMTAKSPSKPFFLTKKLDDTKYLIYISPPSSAEVKKVGAISPRPHKSS